MIKLKETKLQESSFIVDDQTFWNVAQLISNLSYHNTEAGKKFKAIAKVNLSPQALVKVLVDLNYLAVDSRYGYEDNEKPFYPKFMKADTSVVQQFKSLESLWYQCSEDKADETDLYKGLEYLVKFGAKDIIESSEEYSKAKWG
jgi:hypothetical protein